MGAEETEVVVVVMVHQEAVVPLTHLVEASTVVLHLPCTATVHLLMVTDLHHLVERTVVDIVVVEEVTHHTRSRFQTEERRSSYILWREGRKLGEQDTVLQTGLTDMRYTAKEIILHSILYNFF